MSKKSFVILSMFSVVVTYAAMVIDAMWKGSFLAGEAGIPLRFDSSSFFGGGSINYTNLLIDVIFWFIVVWVIWRILKIAFKH